MVSVIDEAPADDADADALLAAAADLVPLLSSNASRGDAERRLPEENLHALREAGLLRLMQPRRFDGFEVSFATKLALMRELGRGDGATAWVASLMTGNACFASMCGDDIQEDIWGADRDALVAAVISTEGSLDRVGAGFRLSGRWPYCSGALHAQWMMLGAEVSDRDLDEDRLGLVFVRASELTIEDTWHVAGMRGTGSNTVIAHDVSVPSHRFVPLSKLLSDEHAVNPHRSPLYRVPFAAAASTDLLGPHLGMACAARDLVLSCLEERGIAGTTYVTATDSPTTRAVIAEAAYHIDVAGMLAHSAVMQVDQAGIVGAVPSLLERARIKMHATRAVVHAREAVRRLVAVHGSRTFAEGQPLQRIWRDCETASHHASSNPAIADEAYGRALLGITETVTVMI